MSSESSRRLNREAPGFRSGGSVTSHHYQDSEGRRHLVFADVGRVRCELMERGELLKLEESSTGMGSGIMLDADGARTLAGWLTYWADTGRLPPVSEAQDRALVADMTRGLEEWCTRAEAVLGRESED